MGEYIFELAMLQEGSFENKLRQVLVAAQQIIQKKIKADSRPYSPLDLERIAVYDLMGILLASRLLDRNADPKMEAALPSDAFSRYRATKYLRAALAQFDNVLGEKRLSPLKSSKEDLTKQILINFYEVTREEAEQDAADIGVFFGKWS